MSDGLVPPCAEVSFGDIFSATFLHDVYLRSDAQLLGTRDVPAKHGGGLAYSPSFGRNREYVLAHGARCQAILITDNCVIDTALGRDGAARGPRGRLLFAPILPMPAEDRSTNAFGRFPIPEAPDVEGGIAELRRCFMVDARDVADNAGARLASMASELAEELEIRWNAYAARRGPLAALRNAEKLASLLARAAGRTALGESDLEAARSLAEAVTASWKLEGRYLEAAAGAFDSGAAGGTEIAAVAVALRELAARAEQAAQILEDPTNPPEGAS